jgi:hypothetical protein
MAGTGGGGGGGGGTAPPGPDARAAAERAWLAATAPSARPNRGPRGAPLPPFRRLGEAVAFVEWFEGHATLHKLEALGAPGAADRLVACLKRIAARHGLAIIGNARAYATAERPAPDQARLLAFYRRHGFAVGPPPWYELRFPPPGPEPATRSG